MQTLPQTGSCAVRIEINGRLAGAAESFQAKAVQSVYPIEEGGSDLPAAAIPGQTLHRVTLKRIQLLESDQRIDFYGLSDFTLTIQRGKERVIYSGCEWDEITETISAGHSFTDSMTFTARSRIRGMAERRI